MSFFGVTVRTIEKVWNHPNADRLGLAQVEGSSFQFVVGRNDYMVGDKVLYFPVDSVLPAPLIARFGLTGKLSGKEKNRIKTVKLRGEISQGLVGRPQTVFGDDPINILERNAFATKTISIQEALELTPEHLTNLLGVTKYEPPPIFTNSGNLVPMPDGVSTYDIEGADNYPHIVNMLMDRKVSISEKLEGTNFWISCAPCKYIDVDGSTSYELGEITFGQRHNTIQPIEGKTHSFWKTAVSQGLEGFVRFLACDKKYREKRVTLRGELVGPGVQKNIYKLPENRIFIFDILVDMKYLGPEEMRDEFRRYFDDNFVKNSTGKSLTLIAPDIAHNVTLRDYLAGYGGTIREASNGKSYLAPEILREGIVIKPMAEEEVPGFGRLFIKQRSPEYLAGSDF